MVPQQPPMMLTPNSVTNFSIQSASPSGPSGNTASSPTVFGSPAFGSTLSNLRLWRLRWRTSSFIRSGPTPQFMPSTSISSIGSSATSAAGMSVPGSIFLFASMIVSCTMSGSRTPARFISSMAVIATHFACKMSKQVSIRIASTRSSSMIWICRRYAAASRSKSA